MGTNDVALYAYLITPSDFVNYPLRRFPRKNPLALKHARLQESFLGQWDEDVPARLLSGYVKGHRLEVWIWFGTADPSDEMLRSAQQQLRRLTFPPSDAP